MGRKKPNFDNWALEEWIFSHEKLTALEKLVALAIFQHRNHQSGNCHPSSPVLAKRTSLSKTTVLKYVEHLESKDVCTVDRRGGRGGNWYHSLFDDAERAEEFRGSKREKPVKKGAKPAKPPPEKAPAPVKHKCDGCAKYDARPDGEDFCKESGWLVRGLAGCPRGKWEADGGPF